MTIYEKSTREIMREYVQSRPTQEEFTTEELLAYFRSNYPKIKEGTVHAHLRRLTTNDPSRIHYGAKAGEDDVFFKMTPGLRRRFSKATDPPPFFKGQPQVALAEIAQAAEEAATESLQESNLATGSFAYEHHLRDYLAKNLHTIEPGLNLHKEEEITGVEYPIRQRRIDLLCRDASGGYVVVELKVSKGHDRTIGQLLTYMGWVRRDIADGKPVRGVIVASEITDELTTAVAEAKADVRLFEYELSFKLAPVKPT